MARVAKASNKQMAIMSVLDGDGPALSCSCPVGARPTGGS
jgi:hypothetical protein